MLAIVDKLYTNRLLLRRIEEDDLALLWRWSSSAAAYGDFLSPEETDLGEIEQRFSSGLFWSSREKLFIIATRENIPLGTIHYWMASDKMSTATVAVKIAEPGERSKGYGTEAQKFLIMYLFEKAKVREVEMYTDLDNLPQQRCLKKLGFSLMETLTYDDKGIRRTGNLYRIKYEHYQQKAIYRYHYE
ncbi:MAG: GNAT family N-acetyltransferase [Desulfopila sp.]